MLTQNEVCEDIRQRARHVGVSIAAVCRETPIDRKTFYRWETGERGAIYNKLRDVVLAMQRIERAHGKTQPQ